VKRDKHTMDKVFLIISLIAILIFGFIFITGMSCTYSKLTDLMFGDMYLEMAIIDAQMNNDELFYEHLNKSKEMYQKDYWYCNVP